MVPAVPEFKIIPCPSTEEPLTRLVKIILAPVGLRPLLVVSVVLTGTKVTVGAEV